MKSPVTRQKYQKRLEKFFDFSNYKVAECITGEGRRIHKSMEALAQQEPFNFEIVFGFLFW
ncbi:MAG TPA: hypothetical protein VN704_01555 [Verrucomicrobiae bacterium]|nr:hypothetical protein [Verrucomicrobiae bacterium]